MQESNIPTLESLLTVSNLKTNSIIRRKQFFQPDKYIPHWPTYSEPLYQEISNIINAEGYRPFYIDSAIKIVKDGQECLDLKGHYNTFDGLKIEIAFTGKYGDPKNHMGLFGPKIKEDSFSSFNLEAKVIDADAWQENIFSSIVMRDSGLSFHNNILSLRQFESGLYKESNIALEKIRRIGKIITLYDGVHIKEKLDEIAEKIPAFLQDIKESHPFNLSNVSLEIYEYQDHRDMDPLYKRMGDMMLEFNVFTRLCATNIKKDNHNIGFKYAVEMDAWKIEVYWPSLNKIWYYYTSAKNTSEETKNLMKKINFVYAALNIFAFDRDDIVDNSYDMEFEHLMYEARKEMLQKDSRYEPLVKTMEEGNVFYYESEYPEQGTLVFRSKDEYLLFDLMIFKSIEHKEWSIEQLIKDKDVSLYLNKDQFIKRRIMAYYDCYRQNPEKAYSLFCRKDPAYVLAREKFEKK
jgi:hypothetical protein